MVAHFSYELIDGGKRRVSYFGKDSIVVANNRNIRRNGKTNAFYARIIPNAIKSLAAKKLWDNLLFQ